MEPAAFCNFFTGFATDVVTRATAANPIPVAKITVSRNVGTVLLRAIASRGHAHWFPKTISFLSHFDRSMNLKVPQEPSR